MDRFRRLQIENWRQFGQIDIDLSRRMTILTGANGAGKTTILNLLSRHFGWSINFIGTLRITRKGAKKYYSGAGDDFFEKNPSDRQRIGSIEYSNDESAMLMVAPEVNVDYQVQIQGQQQVDGMYITSHRPVYSYQVVKQIPTEISAADQLFEHYVSNIRAMYNPNPRVESPSFRLKSALISLATFGYGNKAVEADGDARHTFESFQDVLRKVLPPDLEFQEILIRLPDVILRCRHNEFSLDAASGGISALIDLAWQLHMKSLTVRNFTVVLDEPENHLHPRLQRSVLPGLLDAFPNAHFVVATHNPFVVTSVSDSTIVVLDFGEEGRVLSRNLSEFDRAASANQVLSDVLGVPFPMPLWVEDEVEKIVNSLAAKELNEETLTETRAKLATLGLGDMFPTVVERLLDRK